MILNKWLSFQILSALYPKLSIVFLPLFLLLHFSFMYSRRFVKFLSNPGVYELIPRPLCSFQESRRLWGSPGPLFHTPNWCLRLEMTLSAGFAILNHLKPMWSHPFTLRGIALKCTLASKKPVSTECLNEKLIHILLCRKREKIFKNAREVESYFLVPLNKDQQSHE